MVAKVTVNGQISLPAPVRRRWKAAQVVLEDLGDRIIVRPLPDDPIAAACGSLTRRGPTVDRVRQAERRADGARQGARLGR